MCPRRGQTMKMLQRTSAPSYLDSAWLYSAVPYLQSGAHFSSTASKDTLKKLNDELLLLPGVDRPYMKSLWTPATRWIGVTEEGFDGGPVVPEDYDGSPTSVEQVRQNVERSGEIGRLVAPNLRSSVIILPLQDAATTGADHGPLDYRALSQRLDDLRERYSNEHTEVAITGFAKVVGDLMDGLVICALMLYWYTRCVRSIRWCCSARWLPWSGCWACSPPSATTSIPTRYSCPS